MSGSCDPSLTGVPWTHRICAAAFLLGAMAWQHTADTELIWDAADLLASADWLTVPAGQSAHHREDLTRGEIRVLRYLPTNLSMREIADELYLSVNTVRTHKRHLYQKLGARSRTQAVEQARALGLIAPLFGERFRGERAVVRAYCLSIRTRAGRDAGCVSAGPYEK